RALAERGAQLVAAERVGHRAHRGCRFYSPRFDMLFEDAACGDAALTGGPMAFLEQGRSPSRSAARPCLVVAASCAWLQAEAQPRGVSGPATADEARRFVDAADAKLLKLANSFSKADWVKSTHITDDTEALAAEANERLITAQVELAKQATRF